ncbi:tripartite tricarboxylate transporter TctB family protein [Salipiger marinus]|uniref:tripartite tricarboxylate transporter TctB family protein n=1 Tax=Salipiger marinus TaxID=555512 RepID=UPI00405A20D5
MTPITRRAAGDLLLAALCIAGAALLLAGAASLPPPRFEPLGSAAMPRALAVVLIVLSLLMAGRSLVTLRRTGPTPDDDLPQPEGTRQGRSVLTFLALVAYVAALDLGRVPFWIATMVFLAAIGLILTGGNLRAGAVYAVLGAALGAALAWAFQNFLYISLG